MQRNEILALLREHGVHPTTQRLEVADILLARPQHLSAEQLIERLRTNGSSISKATVYNTLNLFEEVGLVKERLVDPARQAYFPSLVPPMATKSAVNLNGAMMASKLPSHWLNLGTKSCQHYRSLVSLWSRFCASGCWSQP